VHVLAIHLWRSVSPYEKRCASAIVASFMDSKAERTVTIITKGGRRSLAPSESLLNKAAPKRKAREAREGGIDRKWTCLLPRRCVGSPIP